MGNKYGMVEYNGSMFIVKEKEEVEYVGASECTLEECCEGFVMPFAICESLAKDANKALESGEIFVYKCKDCGDWYCVTKNEKEWYSERGLFIPRRCYPCRYEKRLNKICNKGSNRSLANKEISEIKKVISDINNKEGLRQNVSAEYAEKNRIRADGFVAGLLKAIKIIQSVCEDG